MNGSRVVDSEIRPGIKRGMLSGLTQGLIATARSWLRPKVAAEETGSEPNVSLDAHR
jgi:hypothetical protein